MGYRDIEESFDDNEKLVYGFVKTVHNLIYTNKNIKLLYTDTDSYMQRIMEYCFDSILPIDEVITSDRMLAVDMGPVFNSYLFSGDLSRVILEIVFTEKAFLSINMLNLDRKSIVDSCEVEDIYNILINNGFVSGQDIHFFINLEKGMNYITDFIIAALTLIKENTVDVELLFVGWLYPDRLALVKFNTEECTNA